jgi:hypothetical protein
MTTTIHFPPATWSRLQAEAQKSGKDIDTLVTEAVEARLAISGRSFRAILEPIHRQVEESGATEEDVEKLADEAVAEARASRKAPQE